MPSARELSVEEVLARCDYLSKIGVWPPKRLLDPEQWLGNFQTSREKRLATHLLASFLYIPEQWCGPMLRDGINGIGRYIMGTSRDPVDASKKWSRIKSRAIYTRVAGGQTTETDSSFEYISLLRRDLAIPEHRIKPPGDALTAAMRGVPIVFVDDFVGSGKQFIDSWRRSHQINLSFASLSKGNEAELEYYYVPLVATTHGLQQIRMECRQVTVLPVHEIGSEYSVLDPRANVWTASDEVAGRQMVDTLGSRLCPDRKLGRDNLALALAINKSISDSALPLFWVEDSQWKPLLKKS